MSQIVLEVTENKMPFLLSMLNNLDYVTILSDDIEVQPSFETEGTSFTEDDYLYGFGILKDKSNFNLETIRKKAWHRKW